MRFFYFLLFSFAANFASAQGVSSTVDGCQSVGRLFEYSPSRPVKKTDMAAAWIFGNDGFSRGNKIFAYTRPKISRVTFPLAGNVGELQLKIAINSPVPTLVAGQTYAVDMTLSQWNPATGKWSTIIAPSAATITILSFSTSATAWSDGSYCAG